MSTSVNHVIVDPSDEVKWTFSAAEWCANEGGGVTLSSVALTPSTGVTILSESSVAANAKTCIFKASASGTIVAFFTMSDGQKRERTLTITVREM